MKKKIYIFMSILMVFLLSMTMLQAQETNSYTFTDLEKEMLVSYQEGNFNEQRFIEARKEKAKQYDLLKYCDENYFLTDAFYDLYSDNYLIHDGLMILDRYSTGYKDTKSRIALMNANSVLDVSHHRYVDSDGNYIANGLWTLSNSQFAFCAQGLNASPKAGDATSYPYVINNANLRKCLYYGYKGPKDILTSRYGESSAIVLTDELVSNAYSSTCISKEANNGYHWNHMVQALWNEIISKPEPVNYDAYMVDVQGQGYNWQGVLTPVQKLVYGVYTPKGNVRLKKASQLSSITQNNVSYTFKGAEYGLYVDASCKEKIADLMIDETGYSNTISNLELKTYYIQEVLAPHGYQKDPTIYSVDIKENKTIEVQVLDVPQTNIVDLVLIKKDAQTGDKTQGMASLANAQYIFKFYGGLYDQIPQGVSPLRTWTMKTDKTGKIQMEDSYKVNGDEFYKDLEGNIVFPLGTITAQEILPPQGYQLDKTIHSQKLDRIESTSAHFSAFKTFDVQDNIISLKVVKVQENTDIPLPNVTFKHTMPNFPFPMQEKTNEKGEITLLGLNKGLHKLEEFKTIDGYVLDTTPIEFEVLEDGSIAQNKWIVNNQIRIENKVQNFNLVIQKKNSANQMLDGATFGLYQDPDCKEILEEQTTIHGIIRFENLENLKTYYVKEMKAPAGYQKDTKVYTVSTNFIPVQSQYDVYINQEKVDGAYEDGIVNMEFTNEKMTKLPHTGSNHTLLIMTMGLCMMAIVLNKERK